MASINAQKQEAVTKQQSKVLMKNMIRISVSSICYHREIFPTECFTFKPYGNMKIVQLDAAEMGSDNEKIIVKDKKAFLLTQWLECGVFKALEDEYLYKMTFAIYTKHPITKADLLLETYEFKFTFGGNQAMINDVPIITRDDIKAQAGKFIRNLVTFTQSLDTLPNENWITIELKYADTAPDNYAPDYFRAIDSSSLSYMNGVDCMKLYLGNINTPHLKTEARFSGLESLLHENLCKLRPTLVPPQCDTPMQESCNDSKKGKSQQETSILKASVPQYTKNEKKPNKNEDDTELAKQIEVLVVTQNHNEENSYSEPISRVPQKTHIIKEADIEEEDEEGKSDEEINERVIEYVITNRKVSPRECYDSLDQGIRYEYVSMEEIKRSFENMLKAGFIYQNKKKSFGIISTKLPRTMEQYHAWKLEQEKMKKISRPNKIPFEDDMIEDTFTDPTPVQARSSVASNLKVTHHNAKSALHGKRKLDEPKLALESVQRKNVTSKIDSKTNPKNSKIDKDNKIMSESKKDLDETMVETIQTPMKATFANNENFFSQEETTFRNKRKRGYGIINDPIQIVKNNIIE